MTPGALNIYAWVLWVGSCPYNALHSFSAMIAHLGRFFGC